MKDANMLDQDAVLTAGDEPGLEMIAELLCRPAPLSAQAVKITDITIEESPAFEVKITRQMPSVEWQTI
jgi:hypothetical protein